MSSSNFADRLMDAIRAKRSRVVVGLDPDWEGLPAGLREQATLQMGYDAPNPETYGWGLREFCERLIEATAPAACAFKPQIAFFERFGSVGLDVLESLLDEHQDELFILDCKRGDIANTSRAYCEAVFGGTELHCPLPCAAVTHNAYLGRDTLEPYFPHLAQGKGVFVLAKTSNPSAPDFQDLLVDGRPLYEHVALKVAEWGEPYTGECGFSALGLVVGATYPEAAARLRQAVPSCLFLVPGIGVQGGKAEDARAFCNDKGQGAIFNFSRGIAAAYRTEPFKEKYDDKHFTQAAREAAAYYRDLLNGVLGEP